jgi:Rod binding domain-containing protein
MEMTPLVGNVAVGFNSGTPAIPSAETPEALKDATKDFASILFSMMVTAMRGQPDESNEEDGGPGGLFSGENMDMFISFLDQEVGKKFADQGGKDLVDALYTQMKGQVEMKDDKKKADKKEEESKLDNLKELDSTLKS